MPTESGNGAPKEEEPESRSGLAKRQPGERSKVTDKRTPAEQRADADAEAARPAKGQRRAPGYTRITRRGEQPPPRKG